MYSVDTLLVIEAYQCLLCVQNSVNCISFQLIKLKKEKRELENKSKDQEEELDEQAGM